jgi:RecA/RadA recombinase
MAPKRELEKSAEDATVAENSRLINRLYRSLINVMAREKGRGHLPLILFVNQFRSKIGVSFGDSRVLPGGAAMKFFASTMLEVKKLKEHTAKDTDDYEVFDSNDIAFALKKTKSITALTAGEFNLIRNAENTLGYGHVNDSRVVATFAKRVGLITGGGASWRIEDCDTKFSKLAEIETYFNENEIFFTELKKKIIARKRKMVGLASYPLRDNYLLSW